MEMSSLLDRSRAPFEAKLEQADLPPSTCGLVGVYCVCEALKVSFEMSATHLKFITHRAHRGSVGTYLCTRYCAGMTSEGLAEAAEEISYRELYSRFFPTYGVSANDIARFLRHWLNQHVIVVCTMNPQQLDTEFTPPDKLADAWHHHPVAAVCGEGFRMMYPDVTYSIEELGRTLNSESVVMVKEQDILFQTAPKKGAIFGSRRDFGDVELLRKQKDRRWEELGTVGKIMGLQSRSTLLYDDDPSEPSLLDPSRRIKIPAAYKPGITIFVRWDDTVTRKKLDNYPLLTT